MLLPFHRHKTLIHAGRRVLIACPDYANWASLTISILLECSVTRDDRSPTNLDVFRPLPQHVNPYAPPQPGPPKQSWWARLGNIAISWVRRWLFARSPDFAKGDPIICGGIAYFIDPSDSQTLYAGSPSSTQSDDRFSLIIAEALNHLPDFLAQRGESIPRVDDRRLVVRIVEDYTGICANYSRAVEVLAAPLIASKFSQYAGEPDEASESSN